MLEWVILHEKWPKLRDFGEYDFSDELFNQDCNLNLEENLEILLIRGFRTGLCLKSVRLSNLSTWQKTLKFTIV